MRSAVRSGPSVRRALVPNYWGFKTVTAECQTSPATQSPCLRIPAAPLGVGAASCRARA